MSDKMVFLIANETVRARAIEEIKRAEIGMAVEIKKPKRTLDQNALMWSLLTEVAQQVVWHGQKLSAESWKCVFSASLKKQDVVPGLHGDFVVLGQSTSKMTKREMSDLVELIYAFGSQNDVKFISAAAPGYAEMAR